MPNHRLRNLLVFVADSFRFDYVPKSIIKRGKLIPTLSPSSLTPISFCSLLAARSPLNHNVRSFFDTLHPSIPTIFDLFESSVYYDHPQDPMVRIVLKDVLRKQPIELGEVEEPFVWIERAMETHVPYGEMRHGNEIRHLEKRDDILTYFNSLRKGRDFSAICEEYQKGVDKVEEHFWYHIDELDQRGLLNETLIIFTSDHGERLGERVLFSSRVTHTTGIPCSYLVRVPTIFLYTDLRCKWMRTIDILPTALALMGKNINGCDGVNVNQTQPESGSNLSASILTYWEFLDGDFRVALSKTPKYSLLRMAFSDLLDWLGLTYEESRVRRLLKTPSLTRQHRHVNK